MERRRRNVTWPKLIERRGHHVTTPGRLVRWLTRHSITIGMLFLLAGVLGLIVGTAYGSRPQWPAPFVFYFTSSCATIAIVHALFRPVKQPRIAAVLGVAAAAAMRGSSFLIQGTSSGLVVSAAVGAYLIAIGLAVLTLAQAFGETLGGSHRTWDG